MIKLVIRFTLFSLGFGVTCLLCGCPRPVEQCGVDGLDYSPCIENKGYLVDMSTPPTQAGKESIMFGDSIVVGGDCARTCGFKNKLEEETDLSVANYGIAGYTARWEVNGGFPYKGPGGSSPAMWRSSQSIENNPGAQKVYIHIGGNDVLDCYLKEDTAPPECVSMPWPNNPPTCTVGGTLDAFLNQIVASVKTIVENYQNNTAAEILVLSTGHFVPDCSAFSLIIPDEGKRNCINAGFDVLRDKLENMASVEGIRFVDLNEDNALAGHRCTDDCVHLDCGGFPLIVEDILAVIS